MACVNHPDVPEATQCDNCGRQVCADCFVMLEGRRICGRCKAEAVRRVERGGRLETGIRAPSPWERDRSLSSLVETTRRVLFSPKEFFGGLALEGSGFWTYLLALGWPSAVLGALLVFLMPSLSFGQNPFTAMGGLGAGMLLVVVLVAPLQVMVGVAIYSGILHLFLRIVGGATGRLETTTRVVGYAQAVLAFNWIPVVGPLVAVVWQAVIAVVGLRELHGTTTAKALAAVLLPLVLCFGSIFLLAAMAMLTHVTR